jgi:hypothetical protein
MDDVLPKTWAPIMHARRLLFHDGAESYPLSSAVGVTTTDLVMCPVAVSAGGPVPEWCSELYRVAFADAVASARSVRFERLQRFWPN